LKSQCDLDDPLLAKDTKSAMATSDE
jgi:hypothetical protein